MSFRAHDCTIENPTLTINDNDQAPTQINTPTQEECSGKNEQRRRKKEEGRRNNNGGREGLRKFEKGTESSDRHISVLFRTLEELLV